MDQETLETYLGNIEEFLIDEEKVVTYNWLSKKLSIHVNECKLLLEKFIEKFQKENSDNKLCVSYLVSGVRQDESSCISVVKKDNLKDFKIILFKHVYSIQIDSANVDSAFLANLNRFEDIVSCKGVISSDECVKYKSEELDKLRYKSYDSIRSSNTITSIKKPIKQEIQTKKTSPAKRSPAKSPPKTKASHNGGIASMFAAQSSKVKDIKPKANKNISNFFSMPTNGGKNIKQAEKMEVDESKSKIRVAPQEKLDFPKQTLIKSEEKFKCISSETNNETKNGKEIKKEKTDLATNKVNINEKSKQKVKLKKGKVDKNRKRVIHHSDSEDSGHDEDPFSDVEMEQIEDEDVIPDTSTSTVKVTSGVINPRKRRKIVDKTYTDEEGYILTKKVEVYESCSEDEQENVKLNVVDTNKIKAEIKKEVKDLIKGKKKISPPKGKQATLMNFFTKK